MQVVHQCLTATADSPFTTVLAQSDLVENMDSVSALGIIVRDMIEVVTDIFRASQTVGVGLLVFLLEDR